EAGDILAQEAKDVRLLDLAGVFLEPELEQLVAGGAELVLDFAGCEFADFLGFHVRSGGGALARDEAAAERQFGVGEAEGLLGGGGGNAGKFKEHSAGLDLGDVVLDRSE